MKKLLLFLFTLFSVFGLANAAEKQLVQQCLFGKDYNSKNTSAYNGSFSATNKGFTWDLVNFNNNGGQWDYVKCGAKEDYTSTITTSKAISEEINEFGVLIGAISSSSNVTSITLETSKNSDFSTIEETITLEKKADANAEQIVTLNKPAENLFYRLTIKCTKASSNGLVQINQLSYYKYLADDIKDPEISYGDQSEYNITLGEEPYNLPTLKNPYSLTINYSSSNPDVAKIFDTGDVSVLAGGETTITAEFTGNSTYKPATVSYKLTVIDPNAPTYKLITSMDDLILGKKYVLAFDDNGKTYSMAETQSGNIKAVEVKVKDGILTPAATTLPVELTQADNDNTRWGYKTAKGQYVTLNESGTSTSLSTTAVYYTSKFDGDNFNINNNAGSRYLMGYPAGPDFRSYSLTQSGSARVKIYKLVEADNGKQPAGLSFSDLTVSTTLNGEYKGQTVKQNTTATATYTSNNPAVAEVEATSGKVTIKAIGVATITAETPANDDFEAGKSSYTITVTPNEDQVLTVAEAITAIDNGYNGTAQVQGYISEILSYNDNFGSLTYNIVDDKDSKNPSIQAYSGLWKESQKFNKDNYEIEEGGFVTVQGEIKLYNTIYEFNYNNFVVDYTAPVVSEELGEIKVTSSDGKKIENEGTYTVTEGTTFTFTAANATKIELLAGDNDEETTENNTLTWTPAVGADQFVYVIATGKDESETTEFEFTVTVTAKPQELQATFNFTENSYGENVESDSSQKYSENGTVIAEGDINLEFNPGKQGNGCRFWLNTKSEQDFRIMKGSNIRLFIKGGLITNIVLNGGNLTPEGSSSATNNWTGSAESVTLNNPSSGSTVTLKSITVSYIILPPTEENFIVKLNDENYNKGDEKGLDKGKSHTISFETAHDSHRVWWKFVEKKTSDVSGKTKVANSEEYTEYDGRPVVIDHSGTLYYYASDATNTNKTEEKSIEFTLETGNDIEPTLYINGVDHDHGKPYELSKTVACTFKVDEGYTVYYKFTPDVDYKKGDVKIDINPSTGLPLFLNWTEYTGPFYIGRTGQLEYYAKANDGTAAGNTNSIDFTADPVTGVTGIEIDMTADDCEIYDMMGRRVAAENLAKGLYIVRQGGKTMKVMVK